MKQFNHSPIVYSTQKIVSNEIKLLYKEWDKEENRADKNQIYANSIFSRLSDACEKNGLPVIEVIELLN